MTQKEPKVRIGSNRFGTITARPAVTGPDGQTYQLTPEGLIPSAQTFMINLMDRLSGILTPDEPPACEDRQKAAFDLLFKR